MTEPAALPPLLAPIGPSQSDLLIHFCGRRQFSKATPTVPDDIRNMTPQQRLDAILSTQTLRAFIPFRASTPAVCLSESPIPHLQHMLTDRQMAPWAVLFKRADVVAAGGGAIAYPPEQVHQTWPTPVQVWGNPIRSDGHRLMDFTWEREWRIPSPNGPFTFQPQQIAAILVGDLSWAPTPTGFGWIHPVTRTLLPGPTVLGAVQVPLFPPAWVTARLWYWDNVTLWEVPRYSARP